MGYGNFQATKLSTDIGAADATIKVDVLPKDKTGAVITSGRLVIEARKTDKREIIKYTNVDLGTVSVTGVSRGQGGTTAKPHSKGVLVEMNPTAEDWEEALGVPQNIIQRQDENLADFVNTGLVWSQVSLLTGQMSAGTFYLDGNRVAKAAIASNLFAASKDTYIDIDAAGAITYTPVANGATTGFALAANRIRLAKVVTDGTTITSIQTSGFDAFGNRVSYKGSVTGAQAPALFWEEVGRDKVLSGTKTQLTVFIPNRKYIRLVLVQHAGGTSLSSGVRFNNDSGTNYAYRTTENGGADSAGTNQTWAQMGNNTLEGMTAEFQIINEAIYRKVMAGIEVFWDTAGNTYRNTYAAYWQNNTVQINRIDLVSTAGSFAVGSEIIVLAHD